MPVTRKRSPESRDYGKTEMESRIFCSGRFHFDYLEEGYVRKASEDYRAVLLGDVNRLLKGSGLTRINDCLSYVGPYYFEPECATDRDIVETEMHMIRECDAAFFLLEDGLCPGTVSEMIFAATLQKRMCIAYVRNEEETESSLRSACWYPINMCRIINRSEIEVFPAADRMQAEKILLERIRNRRASAAKENG